MDVIVQQPRRATGSTPQPTLTSGDCSKSQTDVFSSCLIPKSFHWRCQSLNQGSPVCSTIPPQIRFRSNFLSVLVGPSLLPPPSFFLKPWFKLASRLFYTMHLFPLNVWKEESWSSLPQTPNPTSVHLDKGLSKPNTQLFGWSLTHSVAHNGKISIKKHYIYLTMYRQILYLIKSNRGRNRKK